MTGANEVEVQQGLMRQAVVFAIGIFVLLAVAVTGLILRGGEDTAAAAPGREVDVAVKEWTVQSPTASVKGEITFHVTNDGTQAHELLVLETDLPAGEIPLTDAGDPPVPVETGADRVTEDLSIGETGGEPLEPGEERSFTLDLAPGKYVLICNLSGHYANGMHRSFTVL